MLHSPFQLKLHGGPDRWYIHVTDSQGIQHATGTYYARGLGLRKSDPVALGNWASSGRTTLEFMQDFAHGLLSLKVAMADMAELVEDGAINMVADVVESNLRVQLRCGKMSVEVEAPFLEGAAGQDLEVTPASTSSSLICLVKNHPKKYLILMWHEWAMARIREMLNSKTQEELAALREAGKQTWY